MKLICEEGFLELQRSDSDDWNSPSESDTLLNVAVDVSGYSAADQSWVVAGEWGKFLSELETLDERRQGRAVVEGASPDDLRLEFYSTDSAGYMAVQGPTPNAIKCPNSIHLVHAYYTQFLIPEYLNKTVPQYLQFLQ